MDDILNAVQAHEILCAIWDSARERSRLTPPQLAADGYCVFCGAVVGYEEDVEPHEPDCVWLRVIDYIRA